MPLEVSVDVGDEAPLSSSVQARVSQPPEHLRARRAAAKDRSPPPSITYCSKSLAKSAPSSRACGLRPANQKGPNRYFFSPTASGLRRGAAIPGSPVGPGAWESGSPASLSPVLRHGRLHRDFEQQFREPASSCPASQTSSGVKDILIREYFHPSAFWQSARSASSAATSRSVHIFRIIRGRLQLCTPIKASTGRRRQQWTMDF